MNVDSDTQITATSPAGTGTVDVTVITPQEPAPPARPTSSPTYSEQPHTVQPQADGLFLLDNDTIR